jgi:hypothetical protein
MASMAPSTRHSAAAAEFVPHFVSATAGMMIEEIYDLE